MNLKSLLKFASSQFLAMAAATSALALLAGCETSSITGKPAGTEEFAPTSELILTEGDTVKLEFPGAPSLNTSQAIRRDGVIALQGAGEIKASGYTTKQLQDVVIKAYGAQLQIKEVYATLQSSQFQFFVSGAVNRPGRYATDRHLTVLQAIMEAGGYDTQKSDMSKVLIIRTEGDSVRNMSVNLLPTLKGQETKLFYIRPMDIIQVTPRQSFL